MKVSSHKQHGAGVPVWGAAVLAAIASAALIYRARDGLRARGLRAPSAILDQLNRPLARLRSTPREQPARSPWHWGRALRIALEAAVLIVRVRAQFRSLKGRERPDQAALNSSSSDLRMSATRPRLSVPPPPSRAATQPAIAHGATLQTQSKLDGPMTEERINLRMLGAVALAAAKRWSSQRAASKSAALALYTLFSLAPILVLVIAVAGSVFGRAQVSGQLIGEMRVLVGDQGAAVVQTVIASAQNTNQGLVAGIISSVLVLIGATSAFAELKDSLDELWGVPASESSGLWGLVRERFLSLGILLVLALLLLASLVVDSGLQALQTLWGTYWSTSAFATGANIFVTAFSFIVVASLFAAIYKLLPGTAVAWRDVILGAIVTASLFVVGKSLIGIYLGHGFVSSAYGAAGSVVALIAWVYYSALIFFYGALLTHEYAIRIGSRKMGGPLSPTSASSSASGA